MLNFGPLTCPHCLSNQLIKWGTYARNVIYFTEDISKIESKVLTVQRVRCKSCGKTHALLPQGIIPYKQMTLEVVIEGLIAILTSNSLKFCQKYGIAEEILKANYVQFKKKHLSRLKVLISNLNIIDALKKIKSNLQLQFQYIIYHNRTFMQNKLGIIGISPS